MRHLRLLLLSGCALPVLAATFGTTVTIGGHVADLAVDGRRGVVYVANFTANRIEVLSMADNTLKTPIYVAPRPGTIAMSPDNRYLVIGHFDDWTIPAPPGPRAPSITILDLDGNVRQSVALASSPLAVAFGNGFKALVVTTKDFQLLDPSTGTLQTIATGASLKVEQLPVGFAKFPPEITQASTGVSGDGDTVYVLAQAADSAALVQWRPSTESLGAIFIKSSPELGPRVVSVNKDGSRYVAGWALTNPAVINLAQFPYPTGKLNIGAHAFDWSRDLIYAHVPNSPQTSSSGSPTPANPTPAAPAASEPPVLHVVDTDNLTVRERIRLKENLAGKSVFSPDMQVLYAASDSGVTIFDMPRFQRAPRVTTLQEDVVFRGNACDKRLIVRELDIVDPSGGRTDFTISGARAGIGIFPSAGTTPAKVRIEVDPTVFQNQRGTLAVNLEVRSQAAINIPMPVRLLINAREPEQRGAIVNIPGKLVDMLADPVRDRIYVIRQDKNQVLVYDARTMTLFATMRTGNTPTQMAMTRDYRYLIVGNDNSQIANVYDLETLRPSAPIIFPPGHYPRTIAVTAGDMIATVRSAAGTEHKIDRINFEARTATEFPSLGIYKNDINVDTVLTASPSGRMALAAMPDGTTLLYDGEAQTFVASRKDLDAPSGALTAVSDELFLVDNNLINASLVPITKLDATAGLSSGFAFVDGLAIRTTTASQTGPGVIQRLDVQTLDSIRPTRTVESPLTTKTLRTPDIGLIGQTILPFMRTLAPLPSRNGVAVLSVSGLSMLPWDYDAALAAPSLDSVVNVADESPSIAPGSLVIVRGSNLASATGFNSELPVPTTLGDSCLTLNGVLLPMFSASSGEIRAQIPFDVVGGAKMLLRAPGGTSNLLDVTVHPGAPAVFREPYSPDALMVYKTATQKRVTLSNPIHPEDTIGIVLTGLGQTSPAVQAGEASPSDPLAQAVFKPEVIIGNTPLELHFAGLVPNEVGVYQIVAKVPWWVTTGTQVPLVVRQGGQSTTMHVRVVD